MYDMPSTGMFRICRRNFRTQLFFVRLPCGLFSISNVKVSESQVLMFYNNLIVLGYSGILLHGIMYLDWI